VGAPVRARSLAASRRALTGDPTRATPLRRRIQALRDDLLHLKGWWRNRVARIFLIFVLTNLGTVIGVWAAGIRIAGRLARSS